MFGKSNNIAEKVNFAHLAKPIRNVKFETMERLLYDAEKYDRAEEFEVSDKVLTVLQGYIETYKAIKPNTINELKK